MRADARVAVAAIAVGLVLLVAAPSRGTAGPSGVVAPASGIATPASDAATELTPADGVAGDAFGSAVAVSGSTAVVGAPDHDGHAGAVYVFVRTGPTWTAQAELAAPDAGRRAQLGASVAVSGTTIVAGAPFAEAGAGAAYVFVRSGSSWRQQAQLTPGDGIRGDEFGLSVAIAGSTIVAGAPFHDRLTGTAYVFTRAAALWSQRAELTAAHPAAGEELGAAVAVSGRTALVGAPFSDGAAGAAYVFADGGAGWTEQAELGGGGGAANGELGRSVGLAGQTAVVGAPGANRWTGAAEVFVAVHGSWSHRATLTAADGARGDDFGISAAAADRRVAVGAYEHASAAGAAYVFGRSGGTYVQRRQLNAGNPAPYDYFGLALAASGATVVVGAPGTDESTGAAWVGQSG